VPAKFRRFQPCVWNGGFVYTLFRIYIFKSWLINKPVIYIYIYTHTHHGPVGRGTLFLK
jgi:hypothetical protein